MLGAYLGWEGVVLSIFLAFFLAAFLCLILMPLRRVKFGQPIPFAPALATAALISLFWGETILNWYFNLYL
jgi:prepilin signal peptidase PulO-like enzyme (type II secretory pathway)